MFEHDYLELLGIVDAGQFTNELDRFLERREGLLGLVVGSRDAAATHAAWAEAGLTPDEPKALGRLLEGEDGPVELRFRNVLLPRASTGGLEPVRLRAPDARAHAAAGLAPAPERRQGDPLLHHRRPAPTPVVEALRRLFGAAAITDTDNVVAAHTGHGVILVAPPEDAMLMHPLLDLPAQVPEPVSVGADAGGGRPGTGGGFPAAAGRAVRRSPAGDVLVPPGEAHGVALELVRAGGAGTHRLRPPFTIDPGGAGEGPAQRTVGVMARRIALDLLSPGRCRRRGGGRGLLAWVAWFPTR